MTADTPARCEPPPELRGVDGWHWVKCGDDGKEFIARWSAAPHSGLEPLWARYGESATPIWASAHWDWRYIAPSALPAEVDALRTEVMRASTECADAMAQVAALRARVAELERIAIMLAGFAEKAATMDWDEDNNVTWAAVVAAEARAALSAETT